MPITRESAANTLKRFISSVSLDIPPIEKLFSYEDGQNPCFFLEGESLYELCKNEVPQCPLTRAQIKIESIQSAGWLFRFVLAAVEEAGFLKDIREEITELPKGEDLALLLTEGKGLLDMLPVIPRESIKEKLVFVGINATDGQLELIKKLGYTLQVTSQRTTLAEPQQVIGSSELMAKPAASPERKEGAEQSTMNPQIQDDAAFAAKLQAELDREYTLRAASTPEHTLEDGSAPQSAQSQASTGPSTRPLSRASNRQIQADALLAANLQAELDREYTLRAAPAPEHTLEDGSAPQSAQSQASTGPSTRPLSRADRRLRRL